MAYGSWKGQRWQQVASNVYYAIDVLWDYRQDPIANKTQVALCALRVRNLNYYYGYSYNTAVGLAGVGNTSNKIETTVYAVVNYPTSGTGLTYVWDNSDIQTEITHNSDGSWKSSNGQFKWICGLNQNHTPQYGWTNFSPSGIASIDRSGGSNSADIVSSSMKSITIEYTSSVATDLIQYSFDGSTWVNSGASIDTGGNSTQFTINNLNPNTYYNIRIRHRRNYNEVYSSNASVTFTTPKPTAPKKGNISTISLNAFGGNFEWSGFSFGDGASFGYYRYSLNNIDWAQCGQNTSLVLTNLKSETTYTLYVQLVDNYGSTSEIASISFTTLVDQVKVNLKSNGTWKNGKLWYKLNGTWKKVKKLYIKKNGSWSKVK